MHSMNVPNAHRCFPLLLPLLLPQVLEANFSSEAHIRLVKGFVSLRQLLRIKMADDADMDMAIQVR
jgi:hypothetical protein